MHEADYWPGKVVFVTWTYDDDHLPPFASLRKKDFQDMIKRLRFHLCKDHGSDYRIKYFACGEYGGITNRPHYHAIIFGLGQDDFCDKREILSRLNLHRFPSTALYDYHTIGNDNIIYKGILKDTWDKGRIVVGFDMADGQAFAYTAGYIQKKLNGQLGKAMYQCTGREPPFQCQSQGIGLGFVLDHADRIKREMTVPTGGGHKMMVPRYYRDKLNITHADLQAAMAKYTQDLQDDFIAHYPDTDIATYDPTAYKRRKRIFDAVNAVCTTKPGDLNFTGFVPVEVKLEDVSQDSPEFAAYKIQLAKGKRLTVRVVLTCLILMPSEVAFDRSPLCRGQSPASAGGF
jgi:hypothetical protein